MGSAYIKLKNVSKEYYIFQKNIQRVLGILFGKKPNEIVKALTDVSIDAAPGERIAVFGVSDSGCSTLLRIISGVTFPTSGKVKTKGEINAFLNSKVGYDKEFSCIENIYLKANAIGLPKGIIRANEKQIIEFAGLEKYRDLPLKGAPRDAQLKMALAIHTLYQSDIFVLDERVANAKQSIRQSCQGKLRDYINSNPEMIVFATNIPRGFGKILFSRGIILDKGKIVFDGPIEDAMEEYYLTYKKSSKDIQDESTNETEDNFEM